MLKRQQKILAGKHRSAESNASLGRSLAFIAGAINAGGFMVVQQYTSHMTGILSLAADSLALAEWRIAVSMFFYIACFICGAATTALLVIWARGLHLHSQYALPLALEALLLIIFGSFYSKYTAYLQPSLSWIIALLCYLMGLQNAVITKISSTTIRTTHITGMATDIGIELGRLLCAITVGNIQQTKMNKEKIFLHFSLISMFLLGGVSGAYCFKYMGFLSVIPLASYLLFIAFFPIKRDFTIRRYVRKRKSSNNGLMI